jgi:hypothetical protein
MAVLVLLAALGAIGTGYLSTKLLFPSEADKLGRFAWLYSCRLSWLRCIISVPLVLLLRACVEGLVTKFGHSGKKGADRCLPARRWL